MSRRVLGRVPMLVVLWLLAWGEATVANLASGVVVAAALLLAFPPDPGAGRSRIRASGVIRLLGYVAYQLITSNIRMTREILRRRPRTRPGVVVHRLAHPSEEVVTMMTTVIALSPGTMTVEIDGASEGIHVHFLLLDDVDAARRSLGRLEDLVVAAIGAPPPLPNEDERTPLGKTT